MAVKPLKVNLKQLLESYTNDRAKQRAITPVLKKPEVKRELAMQIIDAIVERTLSGKDKNNKDFKPYKTHKGQPWKDYVNSLIFKIYKGGKRKPDLKLTGNMLTAIDAVKIGLNDIEIGFNDKQEADKAEGHVLGTGGHGGLPVRDFWGLPDKKTMDAILEDVIKGYNTQRIEAIEILQSEQEVEVD